MSDMDDIVKEFLVESHEGLDRLDRDLVELEQRPRDQELLAGIFRCVHTVKGTCGFLGRARQVLRPDGSLLLGGAETTMNLDDAYQRVPMGKAVCYRPAG